MEFVGKEGWPAPLLKNADISEDGLAEKLYLDCVQMVRNMYRKCRLVHAGRFFHYNDITFRSIGDICLLYEINSVPSLYLFGKHSRKNDQLPDGIYSSSHPSRCLVPFEQLFPQRVF